MLRTFKAQKMLDRLERQGLMSEVDAKTKKLILSLDGMEANDYCWANYVDDKPLAWIEPNDVVPEGIYVCIEDCI